MSLNWSFKEKCGEVTLRQGEREFTLSMYQGNAYLIFLSEWKEDDKDMYSLYSFWADKSHAKRMLGLAKGSDGEKMNYYQDGYDKFTKFRFNKTHCRDLSEIVGLIVKAFRNIEIEIYEEE